MSHQLKVKKLSEFAVTPKRASASAAGYDLFAAESKVIEATSNGVVKTDISIALPSGTYGRIAPRSGLAVKNFINIGAGVIDQDYRGNIGVVLFNHSTNNFIVNKGDRIAQLIIECNMTPEVIETDNLDETDRGAGGFGSTGK